MADWRKFNELCGILTNYHLDASRQTTLTAKSTWQRYADPDEEITEKDEEKAIKTVSGSGHVSVFEHIGLSFYISNLTRIGLDGNVWNRFGKYTSGSHQYQELKNFDFMLPETIKRNSTALEISHNLMGWINEFYSSLIDEKTRAGFARNNIPMCSCINLKRTIDLKNLIDSTCMNISHVDDSVRNSAILQFLLTYKFLEKFRDSMYELLETGLNKEGIKIKIPRKSIDEIVAKEFKVTDKKKNPFLLQSDVKEINDIIVEQIQDKIKAAQTGTICLEKCDEGMELITLDKADATSYLKNLKFSGMAFALNNIPHVAFAQIIRQRNADFDFDDHPYSDIYKDFNFNEYLKEEYFYSVLPAIANKPALVQGYEKIMRAIETTINHLMELRIPKTDVFPFLPQNLLTDFYETIKLHDLIKFLDKRVCNREEWPTNNVAYMQYVAGYKIFPDALEEAGFFPCLQKDRTCIEPKKLRDKTCPGNKYDYLSVLLENMRQEARHSKGSTVVHEDDISKIRWETLNAIKSKAEDYANFENEVRTKRGY